MCVLRLSTSQYFLVLSISLRVSVAMMIVMSLNKVKITLRNKFNNLDENELNINHLENNRPDYREKE